VSEYQKMRRKTYDSTFRRIDISNIEIIGTYTRTFFRTARFVAHDE